MGANIGGIPELIRVGETGELFESGNVEDLKEYLVNIYKGALSFKSCSEHSGYVNYHSIEQYEKNFFVQLIET